MRNISVVLGCLLLVACMASGDQLDIGVNESAILHGVPVTSNPEVGHFQGAMGPCTATLIGPRVILTAAHCFGYGTDLGAVGFSTFFFANDQLSRRIDGFVSLTTDIQSAPNDIAVAALDQPVDPAADGVLWALVGNTYRPSPDAYVLQLGYGCNNPGFENGALTCFSNSDFSLKQGVQMLYSVVADGVVSTSETGFVQLTLPGDSGGPVLAENRVFFICTKGVIWRDTNEQAVGSDALYGNIVANRNAIIDAGNLLGAPIDTF